MKTLENGNPWLIRGFILVIFLGGWHLLTLRSSFEAKGKTDEQLQMMEFNGDIVRTDKGGYAWNPEKMKGVPGPLAVAEKARTELSEAFVIKGTNDHGIAYLVLYTVSRFAAGFLAASVVAILFGILLGLNRVLFRAVNPFIQILKPISPLAWMPLPVHGQGSQMDSHPGRIHGSRLADPGDDGVRSEFTQKRIPARRGHSAALMVQTALPGDFAWSSPDDCERSENLVRERAGCRGAGRDVVG